jgi:hypothetical protein
MANLRRCQTGLALRAGQWSDRALIQKVPDLITPGALNRPASFSLAAASLAQTRVLGDIEQLMSSQISQPEHSQLTLLE